jgi:hypothetical protein
MKQRLRFCQAPTFSAINYPIHFGREPTRPTTPAQIDGATLFLDSSARCGQFRALAFPRSVPCRSRCHALAGLARARTSDDIRPRAPCTPPPKSFARPPRPLVPGQGCHGHHGVVRVVSRPGCTSRQIVTFAPQALRSCLWAEGIAGRIPCDLQAIDVAGQ